jgi:hypothetical protein
MRKGFGRHFVMDGPEVLTSVINIILITIDAVRLQRLIAIESRTQGEPCKTECNINRMPHLIIWDAPIMAPTGDSSRLWIPARGGAKIAVVGLIQAAGVTAGLHDAMCPATQCKVRVKRLRAQAY